MGKKSRKTKDDAEKLMKKRDKRPRPPRKQTEEEEESEGIDYPIDIWFMISEYITPEYVGRFAIICKSSHHVTKTGKFWFYLYKKYCKPKMDMPERLQPQHINHLYGLRAYVIRALHFTYFLRKEITADQFYSLREEDPHSLVKRQCSVMWHKEGNKRWYFYFKLKQVSRTRNTVSINRNNADRSKKSDYLKTLEDVAINPEEECKILRVTCLKYTKLEPLNGLILYTVSINLMPGFRNHKVHLGFGTSNVPNNVTHRVVLTNVVECQILNWWHPCYPHEDVDPLDYALTILYFDIESCPEIS